MPDHGLLVVNIAFIVDILRVIETRSSLIFVWKEYVVIWLAVKQYVETNQNVLKWLMNNSLLREILSQLTCFAVIELVNTDQLQNKPDMTVFIWTDPRVMSWEYRILIRRGLLVLLVEETGVPGENHWPVASH
jgi:hypothetical protein